MTQRRPTSEDLLNLEDLLSNDNLNNWEVEFLNSLLDNENRWTVKQTNKFDEILEKYLI